MGDINQANQSAKAKPDSKCDAAMQDCPTSLVPVSKVLDAYFAVRKKSIRHDVNVTIKQMTVTKANIASLSKTHAKIKIGDTVDEKIETEVAVTTITYEKVTKAYVGDDVYIVVNTSDLQNGTINVKAIGSNTTFIKPEQEGTFLQNKAAVSLFSAKVAITADDANVAANKADLANFAIIPVNLGPLEPDPLHSNAADAWGQQIDASTEKAAFLHLGVTATVANGNNIEYSNNDEKIIGATTDKGIFLNTAITRFKLFYCPCCLFKLDGGYIVSDKIKKSPVTGLENAALTTMNAIVLHRTGGATAAGAVSSFKSEKIGTHFVVDTDGSIQQTASLNKSTSHVGKIRSRCSVANSCNTIEAKKIKTFKTLLELHTHETTKKYPERYPHNGDSVGIEVVGLSYDKDKKAPKTGDDVVSWDPLTDEQTKAVACLVNNLMTIYNLTRSDIYFHEQVSYKAKMEGETVYNAIASLLK